MADNKPENSATKQELVLFTDGPVSKVSSDGQHLYKKSRNGYVHP